MITARLRNPTVTLEAPTNERQQECVSLRVEGGGGGVRLHVG